MKRLRDERSEVDYQAVARARTLEQVMIPSSPFKAPIEALDVYATARAVEQVMIPRSP